MSKWAAFGRVVGSKYLGEFEAETREDAIEKAAAQASVSLCHQCSGECEDPEVVEIEVEEAAVRHVPAEDSPEDGA